MMVLALASLAMWSYDNKEFIETSNAQLAEGSLG